MFTGLSFHWDPTFVPNLVMCIGVVFVWKWMRDLIDLYFFPEDPLFSNTLAVIVGVFIIYLPDNSFSGLWWLDGKESAEKEIAKEVVKQLK